MGGLLSFPGLIQEVVQHPAGVGVFAQLLEKLLLGPAGELARLRLSRIWGPIQLLLAHSKDGADPDSQEVEQNMQSMQNL